MTEMVTCSIAGQMSTNESLKDFTKYSAVAGQAGNYYYTYFQKFTIPEFKGRVEKITFGLTLKSAWDSGWALRAAVVDSLDNYQFYIDAHSPVDAVEDECQVGTNILTFAGLGSVPKQVTFSVDVSAAKIPAGTYYLILWAYTSVGMTVQETDSGYGVASTIAEVKTDLGPICYVFNDLEWKKVRPYVFTDGAWTACQPNIGNVV